VKTLLKELPLHHKIEFHHEVYNEKKELLATGRVALYFMEAKAMKKTMMPAALAKKIEKYFN
jgi:acyl-CoA thioester hydrolase